MHKHIIFYEQIRNDDTFPTQTKKQVKFIVSALLFIGYSLLYTVYLS